MTTTWKYDSKFDTAKYILRIKDNVTSKTPTGLGLKHISC